MNGQRDQCGRTLIIHKQIAQWNLIKIQCESADQTPVS